MKDFIKKYGTDMIPILLAVLLLGSMAISLNGCGSGSTTNTYTQVVDDTNDTNDANDGAPYKLISPPYGNGAAYNPYVVNQNGIYLTNSNETYFNTSLVQEYCILSVKPVGKDVYDVVIVDGEDYTPVRYDFNHGIWTITSESLAYYRILISTYKEDYVEIYSTCW